jgi:hypothetical protein
VASPVEIPDNFQIPTIHRFTRKKQSAAARRRKQLDAKAKNNNELEQHPDLFSGGAVIPYQEEK